MNKINVLFLGGAKRTTLAELLQNSCSKYDLELDIFSYEMSANVPITDYATVIMGLPFSHPNVLGHLQKIIFENSIDICLGFNDNSLYLLPDLNRICFCPSSSSELLSIFEDKQQSAVLFRALGLKSIPEVTEPPCVVKPKIGSASRNVYNLESDKDFKELINNLEMENYLVQYKLSGPEYSIDCYKFSNYNISYYCARERIKTLGGEVIESKIICLEELDLIAEKILSIPEISGPLNIQVMWDIKLKEFFIMEVNARFGGGVTISSLAGVPWMNFLLEDYLKIKISEFEINKNLHVVRSFRDHIVEY